MFDLDTCVAFITNTHSKKLAEAFNKKLVPLGVTRVQWIALYYLGLNEGLNQKELGEKMNIKDSTVARLIDRMEKEGQVKRTKNPADRRNTRLDLTEKGKNLRKQLLPEGERMGEIFTQGISEEEIEIFKKVLIKMVKNIKED